jgi:hypothetical protein
MFSWVQQRQQRTFEVGDAVKGDGKHHQGAARPQHFKHQQHHAEDAQLPGA